MATKVDESMRFMKAIGLDTNDSRFRQTTFYTAHECLLLPYEQALTRYVCYAHPVKHFFPYPGTLAVRIDHVYTAHTADRTSGVLMLKI